MSYILKKLKESDKNLFVGLAGPGTGKTTTFKTIIESPEFEGKKILVLSFINKLVDDLKEEFKYFSNVEVCTLHSFAKKQLVNKKNINLDIEKDLDNIISEDFYFIEKTKVDFDKKLHNVNLTDNYLDFYKKRKKFYQLKNKTLHSFNSVIYDVILFFKKNSHQKPKYDLILVDEFQDFNKLEWNLIKLLSKKNKTVLVGDDNQSLYQDFRNASPKLIRKLYDHPKTEEFTLDYCWRCPEIIVKAVNTLINNARSENYLKENKKKEFKYPRKRSENDDKNEISKKFKFIDFIPSIIGSKLIYELSERIKNDTEDKRGERVLILTPSFLKQTVYEGLMNKGFNVVGYELFSNEERNKIKHRQLINAFNVLRTKKTNNLSLRKILPLYFDNSEIRDLIIESDKNNKKIWNLLDDNTKLKIETDIIIFKKARNGNEELDDKELKRFHKIFNLKNIFSKIIKGFESNTKGGIEIELTTVMSSKGLSADFVYYVGIDDVHVLDRKTNNITDKKIYEFLVGITRPKKKLTLISMRDNNPKILKLIDKKYINKINL